MNVTTISTRIGRFEASSSSWLLKKSLEESRATSDLSTVLLSMLMTRVTAVVMKMATSRTLTHSNLSLSLRLKELALHPHQRGCSQKVLDPYKLAC